MRLIDLIRESSPFDEPSLTDEEQIAYWEEKARSLHAFNNYIINKWSSSPHVLVRRSFAHFGSAADQLSFYKILREFATSKVNYQILYLYFDPATIPPHVLQKIRKDELLTRKQIEEYPKLVAKAKRLRQKAETNVKFDPSTLPARIPIPGTSKAFNNPALAYKEELYAGPGSVFSWPGIPRAFYYYVLSFMKKLGVDHFDIVYSGKGLKFGGSAVRNHIVAVAANGNLVWNCNSQWPGVLYFPDGNNYKVDDVIKPYVEGTLSNIVTQSIDNFKKLTGKP